jgi:hypothetical protein
MSLLAFAHLCRAPPPAPKDSSLPDMHTVLLPAASREHIRGLPLEQPEDTSTEVVVQRDDVAGTEPRRTPR